MPSDEDEKKPLASELNIGVTSYDEENEQKPPAALTPPLPSVVQLSSKSSMEILSELFSSFDAEPPIIVKKEKRDSSPKSKKTKKSKKKHKHKEKKHKTKRKDIDLAKLLIKQEKESSSESKIKIEGTDLSFKINFDKVVKTEPTENRTSCISKADNAGNSGSGVSSKTNKIDIKLNIRSVVEDGEISSSNSDAFPPSKPVAKRKRHSKDDTKNHGKKKAKKHIVSRGRSHSPTADNLRVDDLRHRINEHSSTSKEKDDKYRDSANDFYAKRKNDHHHRSSRNDDQSSKRTALRRRHDDDFYKGRDYDDEREERWANRERYGVNRNRAGGREQRYRDRAESRDRSSSHIDKKKLLEIARRNAIQMMKSGSLPGALTLGPHAQEKVIAAIKAGGKTIEELTDFCKSLSKKEEMETMSSQSDGNHSDGSDTPFHHPFQIKDRPTSITMNIKVNLVTV